MRKPIDQKPIYEDDEKDSWLYRFEMQIEEEEEERKREREKNTKIYK